MLAMLDQAHNCRPLGRDDLSGWGQVFKHLDLSAVQNLEVQLMKLLNPQADRSKPDRRRD